MRHLTRLHSARVVLLIGLLSTAAADAASAQRVSMGVSIELVDAETRTKYPEPPQKLDGDATTSAVLLIDFKREGAMSRVDGAALLRIGSDSEPIRAASMKGDVVMFHTLEPGTYSLRFLRVENYNPSEILVFERPPTVELDVTVAGAGTYYLGTIVVTRKKPRFSLSKGLDFKPPEFRLTYDARRELEAWSAFKKKYPDSPWAALADARIVALRSPQPAQAAAVAVAAQGQDAARGGVAQGDPLSRLAGDWSLTVFVLGAGQFGGPKCGTSDQPGPPPVTIPSPSDGAVSLAAACDDGSEYRFLLGQDSATQAYALTVKSGPGISVQDFPVAYVDGKGWHGERDQLVEGETQSVTAMVAPIEGQNWHGWQIAVLPTAGVGRSDDLKKPYFRADLTRRK